MGTEPLYLILDLFLY